MTQQSNIALIIDYTAVVAAGIEGMKAVFGAGQGEYDDPLRPGQKIASAPEEPAAPYSHWSDIPGAPPVEWVSQEGTVEITWEIPMRLWLPKAQLDAVRRAALPFYDRYLRAFVVERTLGGLVLRTEVSRFNVSGDKDWSWLDVGLTAVERVNYFE